MEVYIAYEIVSALMLAITLMVYNYKNWIGIQRNRMYVLMASTAIISCVLNIVFSVLAVKPVENMELIDCIADIFRAVTILIIYLLLLLYDMSMTKTLTSIRKAWFKGVFALFLVSAVCVAVGVMSDYTYFLGDSLLNRYGRGDKLPCAFITVSLLAGSGILVRYRMRLNKTEFRVLLFSNLFLLCDMHIMIVRKGENLSTYYFIALILVIYYLLLHNLDRYKNYSSGCFSRQGFREYIKECAHYRIDFRCVSVCVNNIESITNFCSEEEIKEFHKRLGQLLMRLCGRRNVYHTHSFEYQILVKSKKDAVALHRNLCGWLPFYFRINDKNITLSCSFYTVAFSEAKYSSSKFYCILASMRKNAMIEMDREVLNHYHGESQLVIQRELEELRIVNMCIAKRNFMAKLAPIWKKEDDGTVSYEFVIFEKLETGEEICQERIWEIAKEAGSILEVGKICFELMCNYMIQTDFEAEKIGCIHVNMLPVQLENTTMIEKFVQYLKLYRISGEKICIEVTIDLSVNYEKLTESFMMLKNYGITVLLDQFGVTVCNLKNVLNMPFDAVKINHHIVRTYYEGKSGQLTYLLDMLEAQGWNIYLDGIDDEEAAAAVHDLHFDYLQGCYSVQAGKGNVKRRSAGGDF